MYIPKSFREEDLPTIHDLIERHNFGILFSIVEGDPTATHLPFLLDRERGQYGTLIAHFARANPHWKALDDSTTVLVVFQGVHDYISPVWYANQVTVPTWNYAAVHVYGKPKLIHETDQLRGLLQDLIDFHDHQWNPAQAEEYIEARLQAIVGIEVEIERIEGKMKFNQNKSVDDQLSVIHHLDAIDTPDAQEMATIMRRNLDRG